MADVMEVDERFMHIATLDTVVKYMQANDTDAFIRKLVIKKKIAKKSDEDFELTVDEVGDMLRDLSLRVVSDFLGQARH
jgi:hypothetical protein|tara:strand:- start:2556 stop:2792 length:237 start_codon:yes stop_codon:yes gene_type:complete